MNNNASDPDFKNIPITRDLLDTLYENNHLTIEARNYAERFVVPKRNWGLWISRLCLILSTTLTLTGIVFFFAYNWNDVSSAFKFTLVQSALILCVLSSLYFGLNSINGKVSLLSASILVGVLFAVFGQVYQTGADAYQLFFAWAIFTAGWTLISAFSVQWIFWLVITNLFIILWWKQSGQYEGYPFSLYLLLQVLNITALCLREYFAAKGYKWLQEPWTRYLLLPWVLSLLAFPVLVNIVLPGAFKTSISMLTIPIEVYIGMIGLMLCLAAYYEFLPNIWAYALAALALFLIINVQLIHEIFSGQYGRETPSQAFLLSSLLTIFLLFICISHIHFINKKIRKNLSDA